VSDDVQQVYSFDLVSLVLFMCFYVLKCDMICILTCILKFAWPFVFPCPHVTDPFTGPLHCITSDMCLDMHIKTHLKTRLKVFCVIQSIVLYISWNVSWCIHIYHISLPVCQWSFTCVYKCNHMYINMYSRDLLSLVLYYMCS